MQDKCMTKNRGRPKKKAKERRSLIVQFRCTEKEKSQLISKAESMGKELSDYLRESILGSC